MITLRRRPRARAVSLPGHDSPPLAQPQEAAHRHAITPALVLLLVGLLVRLLLAPLTEGWDFHDYEGLVKLILQGRDVYAMPRAQLPAAWAYFPICLNLYTALGWIGVHTGVSFRLLGKLPTLIADVGVGWLLYTAIRQRGHSERRALIAMSLYLFNPLVLYNGAVAGRFDAIALLFLVVALEGYRTTIFIPAFALAIATKTFPIFVLPVLAVGYARQPLARLALVLVGVLAFSLPYIITDPGGLVTNLLYDTHGTYLGRLSIYYLPRHLGWLSRDHTVVLARVAVLLYPLATLCVAKRAPYVKVAAALTLFLVLNRSVFEQYLLWPLPFLIVTALHYRSRLALWLIVLFTVAGVIENEQTWTAWDHRFAYMLAPTPWDPLILLLGLSVVAFVVAQAQTPVLRPRRR